MSKKGATIKRKIGLTMACLLDGLMMAAVASGLRGKSGAKRPLSLES